ncbi:hypothetical protein SEA_PUPPER_217 [Gordonia phage Pupper]|uniref:Uncharacterized protein n=1 Tax=Gordonia phage Pupper TaxID=2571249 RepID=A0A4Y6EJ09_9CAUD|nr:hypothetical protein KHQ83_gp060 [Gordonia phage Pupper]QDF18703.1 hypothetical protein SEA_PUPPER_217 [Gordonia phage Pupper]
MSDDDHREEAKAILLIGAVVSVVAVLVAIVMLGLSGAISAVTG